MTTPEEPPLTATAIAAGVRAGTLDPVDVTERCFGRIREDNAALNAFVSLREDALEDAAAIRERADLADLPLAGVPIAIKDILDIRNMVTTMGAAGLRSVPATADSVLVRRLREAGAIVVGKTTLPELSIWATTDGPWGVARNPRAPGRTPGGSSGGSAAAVAAGMVPLALGTDGLGSIRIPAAACGIAGFKPSEGVLGADVAGGDWHGMAECGPLAGTVGDVALTASVLADQPGLASADVDRPLLVAISARQPLPGSTVDPQWAATIQHVRDGLARFGHHVVENDPPYSMLHALPVFARWFGGVAQAADEVGDRLDWRTLQRRTRTHIRLGRMVHRLGGPRDGLKSAWRRDVQDFFTRCDVLITPALAQRPPRARRWARRSWLSNVASNARYAPFAAAWNLSGSPAGVVPVGTHSDGSPLAVQVVSDREQDLRVIAAMRAVERAMAGGAPGSAST